MAALGLSPALSHSTPQPVPLPNAQEVTTRGEILPRQVVQMALASRPRVVAARLRVESLQAKAKASSTQDPLRLIIGRGSDAAPGATDNDLALSQSIDWFGRNRLAGAVLRAEADIARADLRKVQLEVQAEVLSLYNDVVATEGKLAVAAELVNIAARLRDAAKRRVDAGEAPEVQLLRATIEWERASQVLELRQSEAAATLLRLKGAVGPFTEGVSLVFFSRSGESSLDLAQTRPDVLAFAAELRVTEERIRQERLATRPEIELQVRRSPWMESAQVGLRLQVSVPILDYGRNRRNIEALRLTQKAIEKQREDALRQAEAEFKTLQVDRVAAAQQMERLERLIAKAQELLRISERGFETGALTLLESLEAARALRDIEESLIDARLRLARIDVALTTVQGHVLEEGS